MTRIAPRALVLALLVGACDGKGDEETYTEPVADAGEDQAVSLGTRITLDGSGSRVADGYELSYTWDFVQVPVTSGIDAMVLGIDNGTPSARSLEFVPDAVGTYVVGLTVSDGDNTSTEDLSVISVTTDNVPPNAVCGDDKWGDVGVRIDFDGSLSGDPEGAQIDYEWALAAAPDDSLLDSSDIYDRTKSVASLVPDAAGTFVLSLVVSDGIAWSAPCYTSAHISSENQVPIADAGTSATLSPCADEVQLNGFGSYDPNGDELTFSWSVVEVPSGSAVTDADLSDPTAPDPVFTWDLIGPYTFSLQVSDGELDSAKDLVTYVVVDPGSNRAPIANAGAGQTIEASAVCTSSDYVWSCQDCAPVSFAVDGTMSTDPDGDELVYSWSDTSGELSIVFPEMAWTQVVSGTAPATYGEETSVRWSVDLEVADCGLTDSDSVSLTLVCTGEAE